MKKAYSKILKVFEEFRKLDAEIPMQMAATFVVIANEEGITSQAISDRLGISQSSVNRHYSALSKRTHRDKPGFDLVRTERDPADGRRFLIWLTPKGKRVAESLLGIMED